MKKVMNTAILYFLFAMIGGVFYREFTKINEFSGQTTLSVVHTHLLTLGAAVFLFVAVLFKLTNLERKYYIKSSLFYIIFSFL